jgi:hypothetical protein
VKHINKLWVKGYKRTEEEERKRVEALKGRKAWNKGIPRTQEVRDKISKKMNGKSRSAETRALISIRLLGVKKPNYKRRFYPVCLCDVDNL